MNIGMKLNIRMKLVLVTVLVIVFFAGCGEDNISDVEYVNNDNLNLTERIDLVSNENRIWFNEEGIVIYNVDVSKLTASERQNLVVPEEVLSLATSDELFDMVFEWADGITDPYIYNYPSYYIDYIYSWCNAMLELLERQDLADILISRYLSMEYTLPADSDTEEQVSQRHKMVLIEILLALDSTYDDLSDSERLEIVNELYNKNKNRNTRFTYSGFFMMLQEKNCIVYDSHTNPAKAFYNTEWNWCSFIKENCTEDINEMLAAKFY